MGKKEQFEMKEQATSNEIKLQFTLVKLQEQIEDLEYRINQLRKANNDLFSQIKAKQIKIITLQKNQEQVSQNILDQMTEKKNSSYEMKISPFPKQQQKKPKFEDFMKTKSSKEQIHKKKAKAEQKIQENNQLIESNNNSIKDLELQIEELNKDFAKIKEQQVEHYQQILKKGIDARKEGLIWVIKVLWMLDQDISIAHMPEFLDSGCFRYLLVYAKMDIKRFELHAVLKELKMKQKRIRIQNVYRAKMSNTQYQSSGFSNASSPTMRLHLFNSQMSQKQRNTIAEIQAQKSKRTLMSKAKEELHFMSQTLSAVDNSIQNKDEFDFLMKLQDSELNESDSDDNMAEIQLPKLKQDPSLQKQRSGSLLLIPPMDQIDEKSLEGEIKEIESKYSDVKAKLKAIKKKELERIGQEFLLNNYEKRFNVTQEIVLQALVGEERAKVAMIEQIKRQDEYKRGVEKNRTFTFAVKRQGPQDLRLTGAFLKKE